MRIQKKYFMFIYSVSLICMLAIPGVLISKPASERTRVHVVAYHTFLGKKNVPTDFTTEELRMQMRALKERGFRFITMNDIARGSVSGNRNVLITVDDGNRSVYRAYHEVFKPMGIKPMLAIYPNIIGRKKYALTWNQLKELEQEGCEIAAHGYYHLPLKEKLYKTRKKDFINEIVKSRRVLEEKLGRRIVYFIYPSGETCAEAVELIKKEGYHCAFTIKWGALKAPLTANRKSFELPRYMLVRENWKNIFAHFERRHNDKERKNRIKYVRQMMVMNGVR